MKNPKVETPPKSETASSQLQEHASVHLYSEWAAMPAYYGAGVGIPPPYFSSAVVSGHAAHPYKWSQPIMPPFGTPYPPIYPHGGGYPHPSMALSSAAQGQGSTTSSTKSEAMMLAPLSIEIPAKSSSNGKEHGIMKKLKGFDRLAVLPKNESAEHSGGLANKHSQSGEGGIGGSSDGTNSQEESGTHQKRIFSEDALANGKNGKDGMQCSEYMNATKISLGMDLAKSNITGKAVAAPPFNVTSRKDFNVTPAKSKTIAASITLQNSALVRDGLPPEHWIQDDRELKRERRKQSNRESARRSRLRKQAETEELALKVENLVSENVALKVELSQLNEMSDKLRQENSGLTEKLENQLEGDLIGKPFKSKTHDAPTANFGHLLSQANNSSSSDRSEQLDTTHDRSDAKLHQLLEPSSRTDTVAVR